MGFIEKILSGALVKAFDKIVGKVMEWVKEHLRVGKLVKRAEKYIGETDERVKALEQLKLEADALYKKAELEKIELGDVSDETKNAIKETREKIRQAGRDLIRGKRDDGSR